MRFLSIFVLFLFVLCARAAIPEASGPYDVVVELVEEEVDVVVEAVKEEVEEVINEIIDTISSIFDKREDGEAEMSIPAGEVPEMIDLVAEEEIDVTFSNEEDSVIPVETEGDDYYEEEGGEEELAVEPVVPKPHGNLTSDDDDEEGKLQLCYESTLASRFPDLDEVTLSQLSRFINERIYDLHVSISTHEAHFQCKFKPLDNGDVDSCYLYAHSIISSADGRVSDDGSV